MNNNNKKSKYTGIIMPVIFYVLISSFFINNPNGSRRSGFWILNTEVNDSLSIAEKKNNAIDLNIRKSIDHVEKPQGGPKNRVFYQITTPEYFTGTATLPPVPTYTLQFPKVTQTSQLLSANRYPEESEVAKKESIQFWFSLRRFWPFVLLIVIWFVIGIWYIFSQLILD